MKIAFIPVILLLLFALIGCSMIHGELIHEDEKTYSADGTEFTFTVEDNARHRVNAVFDFIKPKFSSSVKYPGMMYVTLKGPDGISKSNTIKLEGDSGKSTRDYHGVHEKILFDLTTPGDYTIKFKDKNDILEYNSITLKIYRKENKE